MLKRALIFPLILLSLSGRFWGGCEHLDTQTPASFECSSKVIVLCPPSVLVALNQKKGVRATVRVPDVSLPQTPSPIYSHDASLGMQHSVF